jgi:hypothetical protein
MEAYCIALFKKLLANRVLNTVPSVTYAFNAIIYNTSTNRAAALSLVAFAFLYENVETRRLPEKFNFLLDRHLRFI